MDTESLIKLGSLGLATATALTAGWWKLSQARKGSSYSEKKKRRYEEAFNKICIGTIPRLSSFDWRAIERGLAARHETEKLNSFGIYWTLPEQVASKKNEAPTIQKLHDADNYIPKYTYEGRPDSESTRQAKEACKNWMIERCAEGEEYLNQQRLYIPKSDRDVFRQYLVLALTYAHDLSELTLDKVVAKRKELETLVGKVLAR